MYLIQTDDKLGEWGGNSFFVKLYREKKSKKLFLDYKEFEGKAGPPKIAESVDRPNSAEAWFNDQVVRIEKTGIEATEPYLKLISKAIYELLEIKTANNEILSNAGIVNRVKYSDGTLKIRDYPSTNWPRFQEIKDKILTE